MKNLKLNPAKPMNATRTKEIRAKIDNGETIDLNASEITVLVRRKFDFSNATIIQKRGSSRMAKFSNDTIAKTKAVNFLVIFDADAVR